MAATTKQRQTVPVGDDAYLAAARGMIDSAPEAGRRGSYLKLPDGCKWFQPAAGQCYKLINLPFTIGKTAGLVRLQPGQLSAVLRLAVHNAIGPQNKNFLCPQTMFGKPCACCDAYARITQGRGRLPKEEYAALRNLRPQNREARLIHVITGEVDNLQLWEEATANFGDHLTGLIADRPHYQLFAHPTKGLIIEVTGKKESAGSGANYTDFSVIVMTDFSKKSGLERMPPALCERAKKLTLDDFLILPDYKLVTSLCRGLVGVQDSNGQTPTEEVAETPEGNEIVEEPAEPTNEVVEASEPEPEPKPDEPEEIIEDIDEPVVEEPEPEPAIEVGSAVTFTYKGEAKEGEVKELDGEKAKIKVGKQIFTVKVDQLTPA